MIQEMSKSIVEYKSRRITYETALPIAGVLTRLEAEVNKEGGGPEVYRTLGTVKTRDELEGSIRALTQGRDFVYFADMSYHGWLDAYASGGPDAGAQCTTPKTYIYVFGNPLIAQGMLRHDLAAALYIPPRIFVSELPEGRGTRVVYDDPATTIPVPAVPGGVVDAEMRSAAEDLGEKVEALVKKITQV